MINGIIFLFCNSFVDVMFDTALGKYPIYLILQSVFGCHPVFALPITRSTEVNVVIDQVLSLLQTDSLTSTYNLKSNVLVSVFKDTQIKLSSIGRDKNFLRS